MSLLYDTPTSTLQGLAGHKTGNWFQDTYTDMVSGGITRGEDGSIQRSGMAWLLQGAEQNGSAESLLSTREQAGTNKAIQEMVLGSGLTDTEILEASGGRKLTTIEGARSAILRAKDTKAQKPSEETIYNRTRQKGIDEINANNSRLAQQQQIWREKTDAARATREWQGQQDNIRLKLAEMAASREAGERSDIRGIEAGLEKAHLENARLLQVEENRRLDRKEKAMMAMISGGTDALSAAFGLIM